MSATLRLLQFSDPHLFGNAEGMLREVVTLRALQAVVEHARRYFPARDGILLTGDLVQEDAGGYLLLKECFARSREPVYCLPGNHDLPEEMHRILQGAPFQVGGTFKAAGWLVMLLDTWQADSAAGKLGTAQLAELERGLKAHPDLHVLLCLHHHPIAMGSQWLDEVGLEDAQPFLDIVARHRNVRGVLWGHVHQSLDRFVDGVRFMASPATCAQFLPRSEGFAVDRRPPGYRVLELHPDGSIATEVVWVESEAASRAA